MPAQSRAQRRRANTRQQPYTPSQNVIRPKVYGDSVDGEITALPEATVQAVAEVPVGAPSSSKVARRLRTRSAPEPVDYSKDYRDVGKDLRLIALWSVLLFVVMVGLFFARANGLF